MKTKHWLIAAAAVAVGGVLVYSRLKAGDPPLPKVPLTAEVARTDAPQLPLPPVVLPPDEPLVMPPVPVTEAAAIPLPTQKLDAGATSPVTLASATEPVIPPVPAVPPVPVSEPAIPPVAPAVPPVPVPSAPAVPAAPPLPTPGPVVPLEGPLAPPAVPVVPANPEPPVPSPITPVEPSAVPPVAPVVPVVPPALPATPAMPTTLPLPVPAPTTMPTAPPVPAPTMQTVPVLPPPDVQPTMPASPAPNVPAQPVTLPAPTTQLLPSSVPTAVPSSEPVPTKPDNKPAPVVSRPPEALAVTGRFVVLQDNKLIEGAVSVAGDTVFVTQSAIKRKFAKSQVQFVGDSRDEVYRFMVAKVPATSAAARLQVARWCMFNGMREQALAEAREVQKIRPNPGEGERAQTAARDLARSLELSLQQYPAESAAKMTAPAEPTFTAELAPAPARPAPPAVLDPEPDVSPEAALVFGARVQPFLANRCTECHAKPDHPGTFKLVRVNPADAGPQATRTNLRAVAGQLRKDDPAASPLLIKSLSAHGGMKLPAIESRQAVVYQSLEAWTALAVGTPLAVPPQAPTPPGPQSGDLSLPLPPALATPTETPLPPVLPTPIPPVTANPLPVPPGFPTPVAPAPVAPPTPIIPPASAPVPPALPPVPKPVPPIPPADAGAMPLPVVPSPTVPAVPVPPAPGGTSQFGTTIPPKVPATGPTGGDEFDPAGFNQLPKK